MPSLLRQIERVPVASLELYPGNPRRGNVDAIASSLQENQQYAPIIVQQSTRYVLAGNHTLRAARSLGWPEVDAVFVDVDDTQARKILLSANRTSDLAVDDPDALAELLSYLDGDYAGTGWAEEDVSRLVHAAEYMPPLDPDPPPGPDATPARCPACGYTLTAAGPG
jgi:ParB-like nuclease domain